MSRLEADTAPAVLSIDVEDWFHVENLRSAIPRATWAERELRVERNVDRILELMADAGARGTFFVLGWVAERCPSLVGRIAGEGHEVSSHGYGHELLGALHPEAFAEDVRASKELLEDLTSSAVRGYRAPSFSIADWALPVLHEAGFEYDSSVFASVAHDRYGRLSGVDAGSALVELMPGFHEVPVSCLALGSRGIPWGGGGYFRLLPYSVFRRGISHIRSRRPYVFYIHPWELDPGQPRVAGLSRAHGFRHYVGLGRCEDRFAALLRDFRWTTVAELLDGARTGAPA